MKKLFIRADRKRGCFFVVERAQAGVILAGFLQRYTFINDTNDVSSINQVIYEVLGYSASQGIRASH